ncbi:tetratricopeptide repeat protein [Kordiimonas sp. SCSIO 12603]|uniref:SPOR domain-containing protein n=1 Tax=Kordiimonas sp. SCSIO 12603 TaxID=2829596 RepID=UPI002103B61A|nr:SPOR domain-containing protein [Kordiimonas sp. SCSIO 12603]UTW58962.1 tetratricopeptide repeat protein [Kordiimonas sp. SCSIO 12603]
MKIIRRTFPIIAGPAILLLAACSTPQATTTQGSSQPVPTNTSQQPLGHLFVMAQNMAANGNHSAAIPLYRQLINMPNGRMAEQALAKSLIATGAYSEAEKILLAREQQGLADWETYHLLGKLYLSNGQFEKALSDFETAFRLNPTNTQIRSGQAITFAALGNISTALATFGTEADLLLLSNKALVLAASDNPDAAITILEALVRADQANPRVRQNLALSYLLKGEEAKAYQMARLDLDPVTLDDTFAFYRSLKSLTPMRRMQALVTGIVHQETDTDEQANLILTDSESQQTASKRIVEEPEPEPVPEPVSEPAKDYELTEVPPLVEPEGWALQIGAYRNIERLMRGWTILYRKNSDILQGIPPRRSEIDFGENVKDGTPKGFYFRLNAGPLKSLSHAREICKELMERGTECWIRPPEEAEGKLPSQNSEE